MSIRKNIPIILADTSALLDMTDMDLHSDQMRNKPGPGKFDITKVIDTLSIKGNRTMIMPGIVLSEIFPIATDKLTLDTGKEGQVKFPLGIHPSMFYRPDQLKLYQYFSELAQNGQLRCYNSPQQMLKAGEIDHPKGGIVFVSMNEQLAPQGRSYSEWKVNKFYQQPLGDAKKPKNVREQGDKDICKLAEIIEEYTQQFGYTVRPLLLNSDVGLLKRFKENVGDTASIAKPLPLVHSMVQAGMLKKKVARAAEKSIIGLAPDDLFWKDTAAKLQTDEGRNELFQDKPKITKWLEATAPSDKPKDKSR